MKNFILVPLVLPLLLVTFHFISCVDKVPPCKEFIEAVENFDKHEIENCLNKGVNINDCHDSNDRHCLVIALENGNPELLTYLLDKGAEVNYTNSEGRSALFYLPPQTDVLQLLLKHNADDNIQDERGFTPLMETADLDVAKILIEQTKDINKIDKKGRTALILALQNSQFDKALMLLEANADVNVLDLDRKKAIQYLHGCDNEQVVRLIKERDSEEIDKNQKFTQVIHDVKNTLSISATKKVYYFDVPVNTEKIYCIFRIDAGKVNEDYELMENFGAGLVKVNDKVEKVLKNFEKNVEDIVEEKKNKGAFFAIVDAQKAKFWTENAGYDLKPFLLREDDAKYYTSFITLNNNTPRKLAVCMKRNTDRWGNIISSEADIHFGIIALINNALEKKANEKPAPPQTNNGQLLPAAKQAGTNPLPQELTQKDCNSHIYRQKIGNYWGVQLYSHINCIESTKMQQTYENLIGKKLYMIESRKTERFHIIYGRLTEEQAKKSRDEIRQTYGKKSPGLKQCFVVHYPDHQN